jgi:hypothetical protein
MPIGNSVNPRLICELCAQQAAVSDKASATQQNLIGEPRQDEELVTGGADSWETCARSVKLIFTKVKNSFRQRLPSLEEKS